jgi:hypothetical protein
MRIKLTIVLILLSSFVFGQSLKVEIDNIYNFKPSKLSQSEQESKIPAIDKFWDKIKSDTALYLPGLRNELMAPNHNHYFYFDGSALLLSLSKKSYDKQTAANAIAKCDLDDINGRAYVATLNDLANQNINVTNGALKILTDKDYKFFVPEHALTFDQSMCLTYMLAPQDPKLYIDSLIHRFKEAKPAAQKSILTALWYTYSCKGDSLIKEVANNQSLSKEVRNFTKGMLGHQYLNKDEDKYVKETNQNALEEVRKKALKRFSDEAIEELVLTTKALRNSGSCR